MAERIKKGDVVQLRSGGPAMTVKSVGSDGLVRCQWFLAAGEVKEDVFAVESLDVQEEED